MIIKIIIKYNFGFNFKLKIIMAMIITDFRTTGV